MMLRVVTRVSTRCPSHGNLSQYCETAKDVRTIKPSAYWREPAFGCASETPVYSFCPPRFYSQQLQLSNVPHP
jgi:hypothetical protein